MWRVVYTGKRPAYENVALDAVMLELREEGKIPNTIRFLQFSPECVLVGYHQAVEQEVREDYAKSKGLEINRRITGGGAILFDELQIGWEVIADRESFGGASYEEITRLICEAVSEGLRTLGVDAKFRPRNDIEVEGKKISGTGGVLEGRAFLYQGTLLMRVDLEKMLKALRIPVEKLTSKGIKSAEERITWLERELGRLPSREEVIEALLKGFEKKLGIKPYWGELTEEELKLLEEKKDYYRSEEWVYQVKRPPEGEEVLTGVYRCKGGTFRVAVKTDGKVLQQVVINGDFFVHPKRLVYDLEAYLKHTPLEEVERRIRKFFEEHPFESVNLKVDDFVEAVLFPLRKLEAEKLGIEKKRLNLVVGSLGGSLEENLKKAKVMLLPYCAKPSWCDYRHTDDCGECGGCSVGELYRLAYEKGMIPITVTSFEMLRDVLSWCAKEGYAYVGHCCYEFFEKRHEAFEKITKMGVGGVLLDVKGTTCYSLDEEREAYHGEFSAQLDLHTEETRKLLSLKPSLPAPKREERELPPPLFELPPNYRPPKALPGPREDMTRLPPFKGEASAYEEGKVLSREEALEKLARMLREAKRPTLVVGPLLLWAWDEGTKRKAQRLKALLNSIPKLNLHLLPDYRPKRGKVDLKREVDPPKPHLSVLEGGHDLVIVVGVHCYRTDFLIRMIKSHAEAKVVALCSLHGHPDAHLSVSRVGEEELEELLTKLK